MLIIYEEDKLKLLSKIICEENASDEKIIDKLKEIYFGEISRSGTIPTLEDVTQATLAYNFGILKEVALIEQRSLNLPKTKEMLMSLIDKLGGENFCHFLDLSDFIEDIIVWDMGLQLICKSVHKTTGESSAEFSILYNSPQNIVCKGVHLSNFTYAFCDKEMALKSLIIKR